MNVATPPEVRETGDVMSSLGNRKFSIGSIVVEKHNTQHICIVWCGLITAIEIMGICGGAQYCGGMKATQNQLGSLNTCCVCLCLPIRRKCTT